MARPDAGRAGTESVADEVEGPDGSSTSLAEAVDDVPDDDDAVPAPERRRWLRSCLRHGRRWPLRLAAMLCLAAFGALAVGPHLFAYRTVTMRSGSMQPFAGPGDILVVRPQPLDDVRPGQVLTFEAPVSGHPVLSHRVVAVERRAGTVFIRTKGDANTNPDTWTAKLGDSTTWRTVLVVPHVGLLMAVLHRPLVHAVSSWLLPLWLLAEVLRVLWRRPAAADRPHADESDVDQEGAVPSEPGAREQSAPTDEVLAAVPRGPA